MPPRRSGAFVRGTRPILIVHSGTAGRRQATLRRAPGEWTVQFVASRQELGAALADAATTRARATAALTDSGASPTSAGPLPMDAGPALVLWDIGISEAEGEMEEIATAIKSVGFPVPLLVRVDLSGTAGRTVLSLANLLPHADLSIVRRDRVREDLDALWQAQREEHAWTPMALRLLPLVPERVRDVTAAAIVTGTRRTAVSLFGKLRGVPPRTMDWRLKEVGMPSPEGLLGWMVALHTVWRLDVLRWTPGAAAHAAGFASPVACANYVSRHAGDTPSSFVRSGGFPRLLDRCAAVLLETRPTR